MSHEANAQRELWQADFATIIAHFANIRKKTILELIHENHDLQDLADKTYEIVDVLAFNGDIDTGSEDLWEEGGDFEWPAAATKVKVSSTDDTNDKAAATGAKEVTVYGLDADYAEISEAEDPDGQSGNETTALFLRINKVLVTSAGVLRSNQGIIYVGTGTLTAGVPQTKVHAKMAAGRGIAALGSYCVPQGKTAYLLEVKASCALDAVIGIEIMKKPQAGAEQIVDVFQMHQGQPNGLLHRYEADIPVFEEKTDIKIRGTTSADNAIVAGKLVLLVVDN